MPPSSILPQKTTLSRSLNIQDAIIRLIDTNRTTDPLLKQLNISQVVKESPSDINSPVLYVNLVGKPVSTPRTMGSTRVTYHDVYVAHLTYIHSKIDKSIKDKLLIALDSLTEFFETHGSLMGQCSMGTEVKDVKITNYMDEKYIYSAVSLDLIIPLTRKRNRNH